MYLKRFLISTLIIALVFMPSVIPLSAKSKKKVQPVKLYDTHAHFDGDNYAKLFATQMRKNRVTTTVFLNMDMDPKKPASTYNDVKEALRPYPGAFKPFFGLEVKNPTDITRAKLDAVWSVNPKFKGIGEFAFYRNPYQNSVLTDAPWPDIFQFAAEKKIFVMIHLRGSQQVPELESMLSAYPNTKVLLHGPELPSQLPTLLQQYSNLYYTLDTATLLSLDGQPLMYPNNNSGRNVFVKKFDKNKKKMLKNALTSWKPIVAAAPNRVMWGTDASMDWHLKTDVYKRLILFSRDFIKRLPKAQQKAYAHDNALRIIGRGLKI